jgi:hypothetical protein
MPNKKIAWESWNEKARDDDIDIQELIEALVEDQESQQHVLDSIESMPKIISTPIGMYQYYDKFRPSKHFECWTAYTNFDITHDTVAKLEEISGIEALEVLSRYSFFIGVGKLFQFGSVRVDIEEALLERSPDPTIDILENDDVQTIASEIKKQLSEDDHWVIWISPQGEFDYASSKTGNDDDYLETLIMFEQFKNNLGGVIIKSTDDH